MLNYELWDKVNICRLTTLNIWFCIARLADTIRTIVLNNCDVTIKLVGFMTSATTSTSVRMGRWRSTVSCWRWVLMPDLIIDVLSASAMREVWMRKASLATPWRLSRKRDSSIFSGIWRFSFRKRRLWAIGICLGLLPKSVRAWILAAGQLITILINSYNFFWLALLAKRSFFLLLKKTASRTTRLPRLFIMIRLSNVRRICCYKTIFSYISFTFCHGFAVVPCNSGRNLWMYICLFHHTNQVRFLMSFIWISI